MASSKDFTANQIRTAKLILTGTQSGDGGIGVRNIGLAVYDESAASNDTGGITNAATFNTAGKDVAIFVSGSTKSMYTDATSAGGVVLFGGDTYVSGTLVVKNAGRTHGSISGSIHHTAEGVSYLVAGSNITITSASNGQVTIAAGGGADGMGTGFILEDDSGDEVTITQAKEVKFIGAGGITTNWTDVSDGSDSDPYDLTFTAADLTFAGDGGSNQALTLGDTFTIEGGTNVTTAMTSDKVTINATDTNTMGAGFVIEDDSGDEVTITENKEVKIIGAGGITTNWTDVSNGTDADPYDLTITAANLTVAGDTGSTGMTLGDTLTIAGGTNCSTAMSGDTLTINATGGGGGGESLIYGQAGPYSFWPSGSFREFKRSSDDAAVDRFGVIQNISHASVLYADAGSGSDSLLSSSKFDVVSSAIGEESTAIGLRTIIPNGVTQLSLEMGYSAINTSALSQDIGGTGQKRIVNNIFIGTLSNTGGTAGMRHSETATTISFSISGLKTDVAANPSNYVAANAASGGQGMTIAGSPTTYDWTISAGATLNGDTDALAAIAALPNTVIFAPKAVVATSDRLDAHGNGANVFLFDVEGTGNSNTDANKLDTATNLAAVINDSALGLLVKATVVNSSNKGILLQWDSTTSLSHGVANGVTVQVTAASSGADREWRDFGGNLISGGGSPVTITNSQDGITSPQGGFVSLYVAGRVLKNGRHSGRGINLSQDNTVSHWLGGSGNADVGSASTINTKEFKGPQNSGWLGFTADTNSGLTSNRLTGAAINDSNYRTIVSRNLTIDKLVNSANRSTAATAANRWAADDVLDLCLTLDTGGSSFSAVQDSTNNPAGVNDDIAIVVHYLGVNFS